MGKLGAKCDIEKLALWSFTSLFPTVILWNSDFSIEGQYTQL